MNGPCNVALCYVCDFVRQHTREFILAASRFEQACVYSNVTTGQGECIYAVILNDEKSEIVITIIGLCGDFIANFIDVFVDQWVLDHQATIANIAHDRAPNAGLIVRRKNGIRGAAHVRKLYVVCTSAADKYDGCGEDREESRFEFEFQHGYFDWANPVTFQLFQCFYSVQYLGNVSLDLYLTPFAAEFSV